MLRNGRNVPPSILSLKFSITYVKYPAGKRSNPLETRRKAERVGRFLAEPNRRGTASADRYWQRDTVVCERGTITNACFGECGLDRAPEARGGRCPHGLSARDMEVSQDH